MIFYESNVKRKIFSFYSPFWIKLRKVVEHNKIISASIITETLNQT